MFLKKPTDLPYRPERIISLVPSQTELLHYLQLDNKVVAMTKFCVHPKKWFNTKIKIGGTKALDLEKITELNPDLIIANKEENVKEQIETLARQFPIWLTDVNNFEDALQMINDIGVLTDSTEQADHLNKKIIHSFSNLNEGNTSQKRAVYLIWKNPYMTIGGDTFINDMLSKSGFINVFKHRKRYPEISLQEIADSNCDLVFLSSEPYPFQQKHIAELQQALPDKIIKLADGEMFSWYGSRLLKTAEYLKNLSESFSEQM
jgi:hypothetical protein